VGDVDLVVGRLPEAGQTHEFIYERFYSEPACLVVRRNHPLAGRKRLILKDLIDEAWLIPVPETALRRQLEKAFESAKTPLPTNIIVSMSTLTNSRLIRKSDCISVLPYQVALDDVQNGLLSILPVKLKGTEAPVGAIMRAPGALPPAAKVLLDCLRRIGQTVSVRCPT
jgi:DNA-binding transcriptional LysR family regulator